jgi:hypothetical protein
MGDKPIKSSEIIAQKIVFLTLFLISGVRSSVLYRGRLGYSCPPTHLLS